MLAQERDVWTFYVPPKTSKKTFLQIEKAQKKKKKKKKPNINNFFHDHGVVNVALKWNFVSFWHYHGVVNEVENYKNIFFSKTKGSERSSKMNSERSAAWHWNLFSLWSHQESHLANGVAVVMT